MKKTEVFSKTFAHYIPENRLLYAKYYFSSIEWQSSWTQGYCWTIQDITKKRWRSSSTSHSRFMKQ